MGQRYCTEAEVLKIAPQFGIIVERSQNQANIDIDFIIDEASDLLRMFLQPRYNIEVINSFFTISGIPGLNILCRAIAAKLLLERYGEALQITDRTLSMSLRLEIDKHKRNIDDGALIDGTNTTIPLNSVAVLADAPTILEGLFQNGSRFQS